MPLNRSRFIYALSGAICDGNWSAAGVRDALKRQADGQPIRLPKLAERMLAAFPEKPTFAAIANFLFTDGALQRSLARQPRGVTRKTKRMSRPKMEVLPARLRDIHIPQLPTEAALAQWLNIPPGRLRWLADISGRNRKHPPGNLRAYRYRWIPKRNGLPRLLEIPGAILKRLQRKILWDILNLIPLHPAAHGFCPGRSIVTNAGAHCGKALVLRFDLAEFFPSVSSARVFRIFRTLGYPADVARLLMGLCTTSLPRDVWETRPGWQIGANFDSWMQLKTRHLPQGAPTSPSLANLAATRLDRRLAGLARNVEAEYTRYADDLTFSGGARLARAHRRLASHVALIASEEGFSLNHRKTRLMRAGRRQRVTGVTVNVRPNIARREFDRIKAILYNCIRHGPDSENREDHSDLRAHLLGTVAHVSSIHPARGARLREMLEKITWSRPDLSMRSALQ